MEVVCGGSKKLCMDALQCRSKGGEEYVGRLAALDLSLVASWVGQSASDFGDRVMCFARPRLCINLRYLEKANSHFWPNFVRNEDRS